LGDINGAQAIIAAIKQESLRTWPLRDLVEAMARAGDVRGALALANSPDAPKPRFEMLNSVAKGILDGIDAEKNKKKSAAGK
jgi:hypothetical protein